jgi:hypothetical protein
MPCKPNIEWSDKDFHLAGCPEAQRPPRPTLSYSVGICLLLLWFFGEGNDAGKIKH